MHKTLLNVHAFFESARATYIFTPIYPIIALIFSISGLYDGQWIVFNGIMTIIGFILFSFSIFVAYEHFSDNDYFVQFKRLRLNQKLVSTIENTSCVSKIHHKDIYELITKNQDLISAYFNGIKKYGLIADDILQSDFENLIENCFIESKNNFSFDLEISANEVNYFVRELMKPFLERINDKNNPAFTKITSLLKHKKSKGYIPMNLGNVYNAARASCTKEQRALYDELKKCEVTFINVT